MDKRMDGETQEQGKLKIWKPGQGHAHVKIRKETFKPTLHNSSQVP